ncbi:uncharacterized protein LOC134258443 [Saccostrea cucullata]|uniref:uncharacterized protein LOC134258443 n=1 Tax=Saccostrea cuccullata TaxID=36930 RepID=UPI002ED16269
MEVISGAFCFVLTVAVSYTEGYAVLSSEKHVEGRLGRKLLNATTSAPVVVEESKTFFEQIEEFYEDKNNFAMYLVLPCIVLVYGGCSAIYCCYKCRQHLCSKKKEKEKDNDDSEDECHDVITQNNNDKTSLVGGSPQNTAMKVAAVSHMRPASKASVSDVNVGVGHDTPLPWAIPEEGDDRRHQHTEVKKMPPAYSGPSDYNNPNVIPMQMMHHQNDMYHHPMDYNDHHKDHHKRRPTKESLDDYDGSPNRRRQPQKQGYDSDEEMKRNDLHWDNSREKQRTDKHGMPPGRRDRESRDRGYSPTNPGDRSTREETMSGRSDRRRPPRKVNEVKPTPQRKPEDEEDRAGKRENIPRKPPPRPTQPPRGHPHDGHQEDRFMSPPPPYEGHERRPAYNPNPTIRVISQTKGGGPVSGMEMARQAAEMLRIDDPKFGHSGGNKKPKRLVFVAE